MPSRVANSGGSISHTSPPASRDVSSGPSARNSAERPVARQHELPAVGEQRVDRVLQFFERPRLADEELQVVDHQQIGPAALLAKAGQAAAAHRFDETRRELLGRQIHGRRPADVAGDIRARSPAADASCRRPSARRTTPATPAADRWPSARPPGTHTHCRAPRQILRT